jgi:hypothetical protein
VNPERSDDDVSLVPMRIALRGTAPIQRGMGQIIGWCGAVTGRLRVVLQDPGQRERQRIQAELGAQGLLPLLMKARNGARWTREERIQLWHHLRQVGSLSPYLIVLLTPGSLVLLPVVAWWLDRRRMLRALARGNRASRTPPVD